MGSKTDISWCDATWNPWRGCTKIAAGCSRCYADTLSKRNPGTLGVWGPNGKRVVAAESYWRLPEKWDRQAAAALKFHEEYISGADTSCDRKPPRRPRVFLGSLMDILEDWPGRMYDVHGRTLFKREDVYVPASESDSQSSVPLTMQDVRDRVFGLIDRTPNLLYLCLTKRPENAESMVPWKHVSYADAKSPAGAACSSMFDPWPTNLWLGMSASTQEDLDRGLPHLLKVPAAVRFLSLEPLLGPVDLGDAVGYSPEHGGYFDPMKPRIGWVIVGSESGPNRRPMDPKWAASIADQCEAAGVPFFMKQMEIEDNSARKTFKTDWADFNRE